MEEIKKNSVNGNGSYSLKKKQQILKTNVHQAKKHEDLLSYLLVEIVVMLPLHNYFLKTVSSDVFFFNCSNLSIVNLCIKH